MKKFETLVVFTLFFLFSTTFFVTGCQKNEKAGIQNLFIEAASGRSFNLDDAGELNKLVVKLAKETGELTFLENPVFGELKDSKGIYKGISAKYRIGDYLTRMVVPLTVSTTSQNKTEKANDDPNVVYFVVDGCEMKCTSAWACGECTQEIIERCKKQICSCTSGDGGCSSKITFPAEP